MRHQQDYDEVAAQASATSSLSSIAASILLAAFAATGIYASHKASNVYGSTSSDLVSVNTVTRTSSPSNEGPHWDDLDKDQQEVLAPLQEQWTWLSQLQKRRWILIADSFDDFSADEQQRIAEHMKDWAKFSQADQSQARLNYSNTSKLSPEEKRRLWDEYQALSARERKRLAQGGLLRPGGVALAPRPNAATTGRLVKVPAAAINPNRANPPKILPPPEIRIQSRGMVTPVEVGPLPAAPAPASTPAAPVAPAAPTAESAPVQTPASVTPQPLPPLDNPRPTSPAQAPLPAPASEPQSRISDSPVHSPT